MDYELQEPQPGVFEIVQSVPVIVGTFSDRDFAQKVIGLLEADANGEEISAGMKREHPAVGPVLATAAVSAENDNVPKYTESETDANWAKGELDCPSSGFLGPRAA